MPVAEMKAAKESAWEQRKNHLQAEAAALRVSAKCRDTLRSFLERIEWSDGLASDESATPEASLSAVTRTIYLDGFDRGAVPLHFRISLNTGNRTLRDLLIGFSVTH